MSSLLRTPEIEIENVPIAEETQLTINLVSISKNICVLLDLKLAEIGIRRGHDEYLVALDKVVLKSVVAIGQTLSIRTSAVSRITDDLVAAGLIQRHDGTGRHPTTYVSLTRLGLATRSKVLSLYATLDADFVRQLGSGNGARISAMLLRTDKVLQQLTKRIG